jgi:hypothetical protein
MSCGGNRFQCGITRFQKHSFTPDKPSNQELHNENQKRLNELLKAREDIDKQFFSSNIKLSETSAITIHRPEPLKDTVFTPLQNTIDNTTNTIYTPWTVPQSDFTFKK